MHLRTSASERTDGGLGFMRTAQGTDSNTAAGLASYALEEHGDDVAEVRAEDNYVVFARFHDGTAGTVDLAALVHSPRAGVFGALRDPAVFQQVYVESGAVAWPGGIDLAPDAMYAAFQAHGRWVLN